MRRGNWKYVEQATGERCLFDLGTDVNESTNLLEKNASLAYELREVLVAWEREVTIQE